MASEEANLVPGTPDGGAEAPEQYDLLSPDTDESIASMLKPDPLHFSPPDDSGLAKGEVSFWDMTADSVFEAIIGTNEIVDHGIVAGLIERGRSVARVRVRGHQELTNVSPEQIDTAWQNLAQTGRLRSFVGTGWIFGEARKVFLTNHHVLPIREAAATARLEFEYQRDLLRNTTSTGHVMHLRPEKLFLTSPTLKHKGLDYTAVALNEQAPEDLGFLEYKAGNSADFASLVYVVQHPGGDPKAYVVNHNRKINLNEQYLTYTCDTKGGSSGSPLFDENLNLIGIHHIGNHQVEVDGQKLYTNLGSRMEVVITDLAGQLSAAGWDADRVEEWFGDGSALAAFLLLSHL